jgi:hypothetical protein
MRRPDLALCFVLLCSGAGCGGAPRPGPPAPEAPKPFSSDQIVPVRELLARHLRDESDFIQSTTGFSNAAGMELREGVTYWQVSIPDCSVNQSTTVAIDLPAQGNYLLALALGPRSTPGDAVYAGVQSQGQEFGRNAHYAAPFGFRVGADHRVQVDLRCTRTPVTAAAKIGLAVFKVPSACLAQPTEASKSVRALPGREHSYALANRSEDRVRYRYRAAHGEIKETALGPGEETEIATAAPVRPDSIAVQYVDSADACFGPGLQIILEEEDRAAPDRFGNALESLQADMANPRLKAAYPRLDCRALASTMKAGRDYFSAKVEVPERRKGWREKFDSDGTEFVVVISPQNRRFVARAEVTDDHGANVAMTKIESGSGAIYRLTLDHPSKFVEVHAAVGVAGGSGEGGSTMCAMTLLAVR